MIQVIGLSESGSNNTLLWAIKNGINPKENRPIAEIINSELRYNITLHDVNFYELFRFSQIHRQLVRIIKTNQIVWKDEHEIKNRFPNPQDHTKVFEILDLFSSLSVQLNVDEDIPDKIYSRLIIPMILTRYDVQIPIGFGDILNILPLEESGKFFSENYLNNIKDISPENSSLDFINTIKSQIPMILTPQLLTPILNDQLDQLINITKFGSLEKNPGNVFQTKLLSFERDDQVQRSTVRNSLFRASPDTIKYNLKRIGTLKTDTIYSFAIQIPILFMKMIESLYSEELIQISFRSSVRGIIGSSLYVSSEVYEKYAVRITEAYLKLQNLILELREESYTDWESLIALFPPSQYVNAVITAKGKVFKELAKESDPTLGCLFKSISDIIYNVEIDIEKMKI